MLALAGSSLLAAAILLVTSVAAASACLLPECELFWNDFDSTSLLQVSRGSLALGKDAAVLHTGTNPPLLHPDEELDPPAPAPAAPAGVVNCAGCKTWQDCASCTNIAVPGVQAPSQALGNPAAAQQDIAVLHTGVNPPLLHPEEALAPPAPAGGAGPAAPAGASNCAGCKTWQECASCTNFAVPGVPPQTPGTPAGAQLQAQPAPVAQHGLGNPLAGQAVGPRPVQIGATTVVHVPEPFPSPGVMQFPAANSLDSIDLSGTVLQGALESQEEHDKSLLKTRDDVGAKLQTSINDALSANVGESESAQTQLRNTIDRSLTTMRDIEIMIANRTRNEESGAANAARDLEIKAGQVALDKAQTDARGERDARDAAAKNQTDTAAKTATEERDRMVKDSTEARDLEVATSTYLQWYLGQGGWMPPEGYIYPMPV